MDNCTPTNADGYPYLVDFSSKGSGTGYLTENEINTKFRNYYTKTEVDSKIEAIDNENTDSLWTLENGQTLSYTNPNVDTNYPALSLRHDAISKGGNLNCSVLRLINERDNDWAPFVMFAGKNNKRLGEIIYNPMLGYIAIESGLNSLSSVRMYLNEDKVSIQTLVNYSDVPYALESYA